MSAAGEARNNAVAGPARALSVNRLAAPLLAQLLASADALGIAVDETADGATIHGGTLHGGEVESHGDHRIAMSFCIAAQRAAGEVVVHDVANVATSFPGFDTLARSVGFGLRQA